MTLSMEEAHVVAHNILDDHYHGRLGHYNNRTLFWLDHYMYPEDVFTEEHYTPVLLNIGPKLDQSLFTLDNMPADQYLVRVLYTLYHYNLDRKQTLDCADTKAVAEQLTHCGFTGN